MCVAIVLICAEMRRPVKFGEHVELPRRDSCRPHRPCRKTDGPCVLAP